MAGTLRRASVIDLLVRHVRETLAPSEIAVALFQREAETIDFVLGWPPGRTNPAPCSSSPPVGVPCSSMTGSTRAPGGRTHASASTAGSWLVAPFVAKGRVTGAIAARGEAGRYGPADLVLLEGLVVRRASPSKAPGWWTCTMTAGEPGRKWWTPFHRRSAS